MNMNTDNRVSPQAPEIEEAILGACLIEQEAMPLVADTLRPEMFYSMRHQVIYAALLAMYQAGMKIDILTVKEELAHRQARRSRRSIRYHATEQHSSHLGTHRISHADRTREIPAAGNDTRTQQTPRLLPGRNNGHSRYADRCAQPARPPGR